MQKKLQYSESEYLKSRIPFTILFLLEDTLRGYLYCEIVWPVCLTGDNYMCLNPLHAKLFRGNINIYLHFVSFLHIDTTQVVEIFPQIRQEPTYST